MKRTTRRVAGTTATGRAAATANPRGNGSRAARSGADAPGGRAVSRGRAPSAGAGRSPGGGGRGRRRADLRALGAEVAERLASLYPDAHCSLDFRSPFELLLATILSAQCTDKRVNMVTRELFARWPGPADLAAARTADLEKVIRSTGFFRAKARSLLGCCRALVDRHGGAVPTTIEELVRLPGVGRKTANVVLGSGFGQAVGVVVDTHVGRITRRLGLSRHADPLKVERDLVDVVPQPHWIAWSHRLIEHGRAVCVARRPRCTGCPLADLCPRVGVPGPGKAATARVGRGKKRGHGHSAADGVQSRPPSVRARPLLQGDRP
jgi:endonuclease III